MDNLNETRAAVEAFRAGETAAIECLKAKGEFLGAFQIADSLGFERNSLNWDCAVSGAYNEYQRHEIITNAEGHLV